MATTTRHLLPASRALSSTRLYHSYTHPAPSGPFNAIESTILTAAVAEVPTHGFSSTALALGAKSTGYLDASTNLFPSGAFSLVHWHLHCSRLALSLDTSLQGSQSLTLGAKVKALTWSRLLLNTPIIHKYQEALALMSLASNIYPSLHELSLLSDEIWFLAADTSVDTSWYTKRASLAGIYAASELFMTTDKTEKFVATREFMERRFVDSRNFGEILGSAGQWVGFTASGGLNVLRSKGVRV